MATVDRARVVSILTVLVLLGSALSLTLALTRPDPEPAPVPPGAQPYAPAALAGPAGPAVEAAAASLPAVYSYDFRDLRGSLDAATAGMSPGFAKDFTATTWKQLVPLARQRKEVTDAVVRGASVVRTQGDDAATMLVFLDRRRLEGPGMKEGDAPQVLTPGVRVLVDLSLVAGAWRITAIRAI